MLWQVVLAVVLSTGPLASLKGRPASAAVLEVGVYSEGPRAPVRLQGSRLVRADGKEVEIHGVNW